MNLSSSHRIWVFLLLLPGVLTVIAAYDPVLDRGGVSVDFSRCRLESSGGTGENLVGNGDFSQPGVWNTFWGFHLAKVPAEMKQGLDRMVINRRIPEDGGRYLLKVPAEIRRFQDQAGAPMVSNRVSQLIPWDGDVCRVRLECLLKGRFTGTAGFRSMRLFAYFWGDVKYKSVAAEVNHQLPLESEYRKVSHEFNVPAGTRQILLQFSLYGEGEAYLDDVSLVKVRRNGVEAVLFPGCFFPENIFYLESGAPGNLLFMNLLHGQARYEKPELVLDLPAEFSAVDTEQPGRIVSQVKNGGRNLIRVDFTETARRVRPDNGYATWGATGIVVQTAALPSEKLLEARYWVRNAGLDGQKKKFYFKVIAPLPPTESPRQFLSGTYGFNMLFNAAGTRSVLDYYSRCGFNALESTMNPEGSRYAEKLGIRKFGEIYHLANGYRMGSMKKPAEASFIQKDGTPLVEKYANASLICPVEVYTRGKYYREAVVDDLLRDYIVKRRNWTYMLPNWEVIASPKGCFCRRCLEEFIRYSRLPAEKVRAGWPDCALMEYYDTWYKFRSWQHGRMVGVLDEDIRALAKSIGKDGGFMPVIEFGSVTDWYAEEFKFYSPVDYLDKVTGLTPFGPYIFHQVGGRKNQYYPGIHYFSYAVAEECRNFVRRHTSADRKLKLIAYPHGIQGMWLTEPEAISFDTLCFYVNQWRGSLAYLFPVGYDHRYFQAMQKMNHQIAVTENMVMDGTADENFYSAEVISPVPSEDIYRSYPQSDYIFQILRQPKVDKIKLLLSRGYRRGNQRLIAVGNTWTRGELFARLAFSLPEKYDRWRIYDPCRKFSYGVFAGEDLKRGILVSIGALRWNFIMAEPVSGKIEEYPVVSQKELQRVFRLRKNPLQEKAAAEDAEIRRKLSGFSRGGGKAALEPCSAAGVKFTYDSSRNRLIFSAGGYRAVLAPDTDTGLQSLEVRGRQMVNQKSRSGFLKDSFIWPMAGARLTDLSCRAVSVRPEKDGLRAVLEWRLTPEKSPDFHGLKLVRTYDFTDRAIRAESCIENIGNKRMEFAYRMHTVPECLTIQDSRRGKVFLDGNEVGMVFAPQLYRFGKKDSDIDRICDVSDKTGKAAGKGMLRLESLSRHGFVLSPANPGNFYGIYFWETPESRMATLELLGRKISLAPGQKQRYSVLIQKLP